MEAKAAKAQRKEKTRKSEPSSQRGSHQQGPEGPMLRVGLFNTCRRGLGNVVNSEGADGIKLFSLVKKSASCKNCRKSKQHRVTGVKIADYIQGR